MPNLTLSLTDSQRQTLQDELTQFVRIATTLDPDFVAPSLEDFAAAKLSGDTKLLTQESIRHAIHSVPKSLLQQTGEKQIFTAIESFLCSARLYGFAWINGNKADTDRNAGELALRIVEALNFDKRHIPALANAIASAGISIETAAGHFQLPALKLVETLFERAELAYQNIFESQEPGLADVLRWKILASLLEEYGAYPKGHVEQRLAHIKEIYLDLFAPEPEDWIDKLTASLKKACGRRVRPQETV